MSFYFIANNLHFTLELVGSLVFFVMAWLALDAYMAGKQTISILKAIGFAFVGFWQIIHAFSVGSDLINYFAFFVYIIGLAAILGSFLYRPRAVVTISAVLIIPAFSFSGSFLGILAVLALGFISYLSFRDDKREFNASLNPFWFGFALLAVATFFQIFESAGTHGIFWYCTHLLEAVGFGALAYWVWQYLKLRIRESMIIIFVSATLFIATIVSLAFSTILINKIENETKNNLLTDAKVFDFAVRGLGEEASAKSKLIAKDDTVREALSSGDLSKMESVLSEHLDEDNLGFLIVIDRNGTVFLRAHSLGERGDSVSGERTTEEALTGKNLTTIEFSPAEKLSIRSASPVYERDKIIGAVVAGYQLDNAFVDKMKRITGLDMTIYNDDTAVATTAFADDGRSRLSGEKIAEDLVKKTVLGEGKDITTNVNIRSEKFLASYLPLLNSDGKIVGMMSSAKPQADILAIANTTNRLTLTTVTLILLILAFPIYILTRKMLGEE